MRGAANLLYERIDRYVGIAQRVGRLHRIRLRLARFEACALLACCLVSYRTLSLWFESAYRKYQRQGQQVEPADHSETVHKRQEQALTLQLLIHDA